MTPHPRLMYHGGMADDPSDPKRTHQLDQSGALLRDISRLLAAYRQHLREAGFTDEEAFELLLVYERRIMGDPEFPCPHCGTIIRLTGA